MKRLAIGSDPGDSRKTSGILGELSANDAFKSNGGGSTNERSMLRVMYDWKEKQKNENHVNKRSFSQGLKVNGVNKE